MPSPLTSPPNVVPFVSAGRALAQLVFENSAGQRFTLAELFELAERNLGATPTKAPR